MDIVKAKITQNSQYLSTGNGYDIEKDKLDIYDFIEFLEYLGYHIRVNDETGEQ